MTLEPNKVITLAGVACVFSILVSAPGHGAVTRDEAARLGMTDTPLTPLGAIRAGDETLGIPAWSGGITQPPAAYRQGDWYVDPFDGDTPLFRIDSTNIEKYRDHLTPGTIALIEKYPETFYLDIYPTRRSASFPQWYYDGSLFNATHLEFCAPSPGPRQEERCVRPETYQPGIFFPIPKSGARLCGTAPFVTPAPISPGMATVLMRLRMAAMPSTSFATGSCSRICCRPPSNRPILTSPAGAAPLSVTPRSS